MLRDQEAPNSFTPVNQPEKDQWVFANIAEIARYTGAEPVLVDQIYGAPLDLASCSFLADPLAFTEDHPGKVELLLREGIPVGRSASIELRNMHATYAATWFVSTPSLRPKTSLILFPTQVLPLARYRLHVLAPDAATKRVDDGAVSRRQVEPREPRTCKLRIATFALALPYSRVAHD